MLGALGLLSGGQLRVEEPGGTPDPVDASALRPSRAHFDLEHDGVAVLSNRQSEMEGQVESADPDPFLRRLPLEASTASALESAAPHVLVRALVDAVTVVGCHEENGTPAVAIRQTVSSAYIEGVRKVELETG